MLNEQESRNTFDPSKLAIDNDGKVVVTDPVFLEELRTALNEEGESTDLGATISVRQSL